MNKKSYLAKKEKQQLKEKEQEVLKGFLSLITMEDLNFIARVMEQNNYYTVYDALRLGLGVENISDIFLGFDEDFK